MPSKEIIAAALGFSAMGNIEMGVAIGFPSIFLAQMSEENFPISPLQATWIASSYPLFCTIGCFISLYAMPRLGSLWSYIVSYPFYLLTFGLYLFCTNFTMLIIARLMVGVLTGIKLSPCLVYISEVSPERIRGITQQSCEMSLSIGIMLMFATGSIMNWRYASVICAMIPATIQLISALLLPRSAKWLVIAGKDEKLARQSIEFYRGPNHDVDKELEKIRLSHQSEEGHISTIKELFSALTKWQFLKPVLLLIGQFAIFEFSGIMALIAFASQFFVAVGAKDDLYLNSIYCSLIRILGTFLSFFLIEKIGRVKLLMLSGFLLATGFAITGCYFHWKETLVDYSWIALLGSMLSIFSHNLGICPVTYVLVGELLPNVIRPMASNIVLIFFLGSEFTVIHLYPSTAELFGMATLVWIYCAVSLSQVFYAYFLIPETKGKTLEAIEMEFVKNVKSLAETTSHIYENQFEIENE